MGRIKKSTAQVSVKKVTTESVSLEPSALVSFYEIDISKLVLNGERQINTNITILDPDGSVAPIRFHNNLKLIKSNIRYGGKIYYAAPIHTDGFEMSAKGTPPAPKLSFSVNPEGLPQEALRRLKYLKMALRDLDDMVGAKVTRIRTFAKYLDCSNFYSDCTNAIDGTGTILITNVVTPPDGWSADPYAKFPDDVFYIDRKSAETKGYVELELGSPFDTQNLILPARTVTETTCTWSYRGEGCCYEQNSIKTQDQTDNGAEDSIFHNVHGECKAHADPVVIANDKDEKLQDLLTKASPGAVIKTYSGAPPLWNRSTTFAVGDVVRILVGGIYYYFVSLANSNTAYPPPNTKWWLEDKCSKTLSGCKMRWTKPLPFGGFPTSKRAIK